MTTVPIPLRQDATFSVGLANQLVVEGRKPSLIATIEYHLIDRVALAGVSLLSLVETVVRAAITCFATLGYWISCGYWQQSKRFGVEQGQKCTYAASLSLQCFYSVFSPKSLASRLSNQKSGFSKEKREIPLVIEPPQAPQKVEEPVAKAPETIRSIDHLADVELGIISNFLHLQENLSLFRSLSHRYRAAIPACNTKIEKISRFRFFDSIEKFTEFLQSARKARFKLASITSLDFRWIKGNCTAEQLAEILSFFPHLSTIHTHPCFGDGHLKVLYEKCPHLHTVLSMVDFETSEAGCRAFWQNCRKLRHLGFNVQGIRDEWFSGVTTYCTELRSLSFDTDSYITDSVLREVGRASSFLHTLDLSGCHRITDAGLIDLLANCPSLHTLRLSFCFNITRAVLTVLIKKCPMLHTLDFSRMPKEFFEISEPEEICPTLQTLDLEGCHVSDDCLRAFLMKFPNLREIHFGYMSFKQIKLAAETCQNLCTLYMKGGGLILDSDLSEIAAVRPTLRTIHLSGSREHMRSSCGRYDAFRKDHPHINLFFHTRDD